MKNTQREMKKKGRNKEQKDGKRKKRISHEKEMGKEMEKYKMARKRGK